MIEARAFRPANGPIATVDEGNVSEKRVREERREWGVEKMILQSAQTSADSVARSLPPLWQPKRDFSTLQPASSSRCGKKSALVPLWVCALMILSGWSTSAASGANDSPNLLIVVGDDHGGGTLGIEGDPRRATPRLDALAREGVLFERAYCNSPLCTASRQSLITGMLPHAVGVTQLRTRLSDRVLTLGEWLRDHGYHTAAIGKMHFNGPSTHGFTERLDTPEWETDLRSHAPREASRRRAWRPFLDPAAKWLNSDCHSSGLREKSMEATYFVNEAIRVIRASPHRPFAMVVGFNEPHSPFAFPREWQRRFLPSQFQAPPVSERDRQEQPAIFASLTSQEVCGIQAAYYTSLSFMDYEIGRLIDALDQSGLSSRTLVVYLGDNGYMLGQHGRFEKHCFYEPAIRIPIIMRWPNRIPSNRRISEMVEMVDVLPTLLDLMQLPVPPKRQGIDLAPLVLGNPLAKARDVVFSEYTENEEAMVRSRRYKLIVGSGRRLRQDGYQTRQPLPLPGPYQRLYDLVEDPGETRDLSDDSRQSAVKADLLVRMHERLTTTREGLEPVPDGLAQLEAIYWCLVPRDR
jgi:arylsulfatase A-like enzyme